MKSRFTATLAVGVLALGLAVGPAAHRVQHGIDYARAVGSSDASFHPGASDAGFHRSARSGSFEETICILCQVLDAQTLVEPWSLDSACYSAPMVGDRSLRAQSRVAGSACPRAPPIAA